MNIFYFSSDLFIKVLAVSVVSLLENNKDVDKICFYIVDDGITDKNKQIFYNMVKKYENERCKRKVVYIEAPDPCEALRFPFKTRYQMGHSYVRMCIGSLLPDNIERVLCLDSDTLVCGSLKKLWNIDMKGNIMAGVSDCMNINKYKYQFKMEDDNIYCNAGVFLVDLNKWRKQNIENKIIKRIQEQNGNVFFFEQTLMNWSCKGKILELPPEYNMYTLFYAFEYENLIRWRKPLRFFNKNEIENAKKQPKIIHFTRNFYMSSRPWVENCEHPMTKEYIRYKKITPWKEISKERKSNVKTIKHKLYHFIPQSVLAYIINILYNHVRPKMTWKNE